MDQKATKQSLLRKHDIDRYFHLFKEGKKVKAFFLSTKILLKIAKTSNLLLFSKLFISITYKKIIGSRFILNNLEDWLILRFSILCEPNTFDYTIATNCPSGEIKTNDGVNHTRGICNIIREKELVQNK